MGLELVMDGRWHWVIYLRTLSMADGSAEGLNLKSTMCVTAGMLALEDGDCDCVWACVWAGAVKLVGGYGVRGLSVDDC